MFKQSIYGLGIVALAWSCGKSSSGGSDPAPAPRQAPVASNMLTETTKLNPESAAFALSAVAGTTWESSCYRFGSAGDFSKKYWSFTAEGMTSLLLKFSDESCTQISKNTDGTSKFWSTWVVAGVKAEATTDNWSIVSGTCSMGCTNEYKTALRLAGDSLQEGSKVKDMDKYNIEEGRYVSYSKVTTPLALDALATSLSGSATPPAPPAPPAPVVASTGLSLLAPLAGQSWSVCYVSKNKEGTELVDRGYKRTLSFAAGADMTSANYQSALVKYTNTDCTGDEILPASASRVYSNLVVTPAPLEGWISVLAQTCAEGCKPLLTLMKLPTATNGLEEAGEKGSAPGTFYVESPRVYTLNP